MFLSRANKFWVWLTVSSADPTKISLLIKGWATSAVPFLAFFIHSPNLSNLPNDVYTVIFAILGIVAAVQVVWGGLRKIWYTVSGNKDCLTAERDSV